MFTFTVEFIWEILLGIPLLCGISDIRPLRGRNAVHDVCRRFVVLRPPRLRLLRLAPSRDLPLHSITAYHPLSSPLCVVITSQSRPRKELSLNNPWVRRARPEEPTESRPPSETSPTGTLIGRRTTHGRKPCPPSLLKDFSLHRDVHTSS